VERSELAAERAATAERLRLARQLHDAVGHAVTLVTLQAEAATRLLPGDPQRAAALLAGSSAAGRQTMVELQQLLGVLRGTPDAAPPTRAGLPEIVRRFSTAGLAVSFQATTDQLLPEHLEEVTAAVLAEGLANVVRHAQAGRVDVRLQVGEATTMLDIIDDGRGPAGPILGFGLSSATERVAAAGGRLDFGPAPAGGTRLRAILPTPPPEAR